MRPSALNVDPFSGTLLVISKFHIDPALRAGYAISPSSPLMLKSQESTWAVPRSLMSSDLPKRTPVTTNGLTVAQLGSDFDAPCFIAAIAAAAEIEG